MHRRQIWSMGGVDVENFFKWNQVTVRQSDGTLAEYVHIKARVGFVSCSCTCHMLEGLIQAAWGRFSWVPLKPQSSLLMCGRTRTA